jgi:hypothetical protein
MSGHALAPPYVFQPDSGHHHPQGVSYGVHVNLDEGLPSPDPTALHTADFCLEFNGRKVEMSWEQLLKKLGFRQ